MANFEENNVAMGWDDEIDSDGQESIILPEGDYKFEVVDFERGNFPGSAKLVACPKAILTLKVETENGTAFIKTDIILNRALLFKMSSFFRCIGMKEHGQKIKMNWDATRGKTGYAHFKPRKYTDSNGNEREANDVEHFIDAKKVSDTPATKTTAPKQEGFVEVDSDDEDLPF